MVFRDLLVSAATRHVWRNEIADQRAHRVHSLKTAREYESFLDPASSRGIRHTWIEWLKDYTGRGD